MIGTFHSTHLFQVIYICVFVHVDLTLDVHSHIYTLYILNYKYYYVYRVILPTSSTVDATIIATLNSSG